MASVNARMHEDPPRLIWDLPLRVFHWLLVVAVAGSWLTHRLGPGSFRWHEWCGYTTLVLVFFRIVWGFLGPRHARFGDFVRGPATVVGYARDLFRARNPLSVGHNPLGALMVLFFLLLLAVQSIAGLYANDEILSAGPLYGYVDDETSDAWSRVHRQLSDVLWVAIGLHVTAVLLYWLVKRDNTIGPMFSGRKRGAWIEAHEEIASSKTWLALLVVGVGAALVALVVATAPEASLLLF
jgi:cytochrome b